MVRVDINQRGIDQLLASRSIEQAIKDIAEKIQTRAAQLAAAEAVDTGLYAASWRVTTFLGRRGWVARVHNKARSRSPENYNYPLLALEYSWRSRAGRHIPGKHILARSIDAARI